jgi:O-antigen/teichoic acid export membrane protein
MLQPESPIAMSRSRRFLGGLFLTYGYQAIILVTGIWLTPFFLRSIGQHDYGLWLVGTQLLTYLSLTDFGVVELLPQEIAYATGRSGGVQKTADLHLIAGQTARLVLLQLPIVVAIAVAMFFSIPAEWQGLRAPLALILIGFVVAFPLRMLPALLQGLQDLTFAGTLQILNWVLSTAATVAMVLAGWNLFALAAGWLVSQLVLTPVSLYRIWTRFPGVLPTRLPPLDRVKTRIQLGKGMWISLSQIAQMLMGNTDLLIIGKLLGPAAVVPYALTGKLIAVLGNQAQILMQTATPGLCELKTGESRQRILQALVALTHGILTFSGLIFCVIVVVNHWFVNWWVTAKQYGGLTLTVVFLAATLVRHWTTTTAFSVFCFGYQRRISLTNLCDGLISTGSCLILTKLFGLPGAAAGTLVGACLVSLPFNLRVIARDVGLKSIDLARQMVASFAWRFALLAGAALWIATRWSPQSLPEAALVSAAIAVVYGLVMLPNVFRSPLGMYIRPLLENVRGKYLALQMRFSA